MGVRQDIACVEEPTVILPVITSVATNTITFAASYLINMGITANMLSGQEIWVLGSTIDQARAVGLRNSGAILHVQSNTATTIVCEEILTSTGRCTQLKSDLLGTASLATSDRICVTTRNIIPGTILMKFITITGTVDIAVLPAAQVYDDYATDTMMGVIDSATLPDPVRSIEEKFAHGSANLPMRHNYVDNRVSYETSWPVSTIWGKYLFDTWGWVADKASALHASPGNVSPSVDLYPGEMHIKVVGTLLVAGSFVEIANAARDDGEIRMVVSSSATDITLDKPLRRYHSILDVKLNRILDDCTERAFSSAAGVTHTIRRNPSIPFHTIRVKKKGMMDDITLNDLNWFYTGHVFPEVTLSSTTNKELTMDMKSIGMGSRENPNYWNPNKGGGAGYDVFIPPTLSRTYLYDSTGVPLKPVHFSRSYMTIDGARWHQAEDIELSITREGAAPQYAHTFIERTAGTAGDGIIGGNDPINVLAGRLGMKYNFTMPLHNDTLWNLVKNKTAIGTATWVFEMLRSTTFTETWTITLTDIPVQEGKLSLPAEPTESQNVLGPPGNVYMTILDKTPYY